MWKDYSVSYIKNNRSSSISILVAALISALCLSFLCTFFFNMWVSEIDNISRGEGDWHGRITGQIDEEDLIIIQNFANVESAEINTELSEGEEKVVDIYFQNMRKTFQDMPLITAQLGLEENTAEYNLRLLSRYFIHDPKDESPPLLMAFYLFVLVIISFSLILVIHNSFAVSMRARIHQFGIFSSIGATPKQIRTCLVQEAMALCLLPIILGNLLGIAIGYGVLQAMNVLAESIPEAYVTAFVYHPAVFIVTFLLSALTVLFSAWMPARKLSKITPLEAIRNIGGLQLKKKKNSRILTLLFGMEGELAGNALKAQKKALRTSTLSLTLSFLSFTFILCFFTLSGISTRQTYFEKYQDAWDVMVTLKNTKIEDFGLTQEVKGAEGVRDGIVYQKAALESIISEEWQSEELAALGGLSTLTGVSKTEEGDYKVKAPIVVLDDESFIKYCETIGVEPKLDGTIILNQIWDSINSIFRYREYIPFVKDTQKTIVLQSAEQEGSVELPILAYTQEVPVLREEYADYAFVQFIPVSVWKEISGQLGGEEDDTYIRILAKDDIELAEAEALEDRISQIISSEFEIKSENRIGEKITNDYMITGYLIVLGGFCTLLALIGIANVFSNTLGFITQRKREFAQYMSVGMTPKGIRKMFCIEALVIAGRPLLITLPLTVAFVQLAAKASYLNPMEFWQVAPFLPIAVFCLAIFAFVALAYYIGGKRLLRCNLNEALRNDAVA